MNRIREALKGAEPERAPARGGHAESAAVVDPLPPEPATTEQFPTLCSRLYPMRDEVVGQKILLTSAWPLNWLGKASQNLNFEKLVRQTDELYTELPMEYEDK